MTRTRSTILVTGGAGFIGSELVRQLASRGERVVVVDNLVNGRRENLDASRAGAVTLLEADVHDVMAIRPFLRDARAVYHLACMGVRHSIHSPIENHHVNATGTLHLLRAARDQGVPRFVHVSSSEVYGTARDVPMTETHPTRPSTVYGASKLAGECYARAFFLRYGYPTVMVRPFNTYGPRCHHGGDSGEVVPKFLLRCLAGRPLVIFGNGLQTRDFSFVEDTARGILLAGTSDAAVGRTLNLGSGLEMTINDLAVAIADVVGCPSRVIHDTARPGDVIRMCADVSHARRILRYDVRVSLHDGLARLLQWYRAHLKSPEELLEDDVVRNWDLKGSTPTATAPGPTTTDALE
jgi:UDP-glucose 4-epimerase